MHWAFVEEGRAATMTHDHKRHGHHDAVRRAKGLRTLTRSALSKLGTKR